MIRLLTFIKAHWIIFTSFTLTIISVLSLWPQEKLPSVAVPDKAYHLIAYAILMFFTALRKSNKWILFCLLFIAYSGVIELLQPYVNRSAEWLDFAANVTGIICGLIIARVINYFFSKITNGFR